MAWALLGRVKEAGTLLHPPSSCPGQEHPEGAEGSMVLTPWFWLSLAIHIVSHSPSIKCIVVLFFLAQGLVLALWTTTQMWSLSSCNLLSNGENRHQVK